MIDGALIWLACELGDVHQGGDHVIATGPVLELEAVDGEPLLFYEGEYQGSLAQPGRTPLVVSDRHGRARDAAPPSRRRGPERRAGR